MGYTAVRAAMQTMVAWVTRACHGAVVGLRQDRPQGDRDAP